VDANFTFSASNGSKVTIIKAVVDFEPEITLQRIAIAAPAPGALEAYSGEYHSVELGMNIRIFVQGRKLYWARGHEGQKELRPLVVDTFDSGSQQLTFTRDASGKVARFRLNAGRVTNMLFVRQ
jgi:hypothetical protein